MINTFFKKLPANHQQKNDFKILFVNKDDWFADKKTDEEKNKLINHFCLSLRIFIEMQEKISAKCKIDLSYIHFPLFNIQSYLKQKINKDIFFNNCVFYNSQTMSSVFLAQTFSGICHFKESIFKGYANFGGAIFEKKVFFNDCIFEEDVCFRETTFNDEVYFNNVTAKKTIDLSRVYFEEFFDASGMSFNKIDLEGTYFEQPLLLGLSACEDGHKAPLEPKHFANKESARLIKDHFEKQNNITEANKYFIIEQDKYIKELQLKENKNDNKRITKIIPLYLNKWISNFGTDWVRAIIVFMIWGVIARSLLVAAKGNLEFSSGLILYFGLWLFVYFITYKNTKVAFWGALLIVAGMFLNLLNASFYFLNPQIINEITIITNPVNAFKDYDTFKNLEALGAIIRIVSIIIIYQVIVAFRQNTRRK